MRRSTAAAVGTLTGAALIIGVRLSVTPPTVPAASSSVDLSDSGNDPTTAPTPTEPSASKSSGSKAGGSKSGGSKSTGSDPGSGSASGKEKPSAAPTSKPPASGLKDGIYKGKGSTNPYGTVQVSIKVGGGVITAADATYPVAGNSATINPAAIPKLNKETLKAQSAKVAAVSGATYTSSSYVESLQSALDAAKA